VPNIEATGNGVFDCCYELASGVFDYELGSMPTVDHEIGNMSTTIKRKKRIDNAVFRSLREGGKATINAEKDVTVVTTSNVHHVDSGLEIILQ